MNAASLVVVDQSWMVICWHSGMPSTRTRFVLVDLRALTRFRGVRWSSRDGYVLWLWDATLHPTHHEAPCSAEDRSYQHVSRPVHPEDQA